MSAIACAFWLPAGRATHPLFPAPLDDVYIYFDFARSTARGCVLCWSTDTGYSSGATSPLYALVLAVAWGVGFRASALGWFAAGLAAVCLFDLTTSVTRLAGNHRFAGLLASVLVLAVPLLDWTLVSGMEAALLAAIIGRALCAVQRSVGSAAFARPGAQLRAGVWIAAVALARPECIPLALALAIAVAHGAGSVSLARSLVRAAGPALVALAVFAGANLALTGELQANGALRKLITEDPYASGSDVALMIIVHAIRLYTLGFEVALGGAWPARALIFLAALSLAGAGTRRLGAALLVGAIAAFALVTVNKTAPYQNLRYVAPSLLMLLAAAGLGVRAGAQRSRVAGAGAALLTAYVVVSAAPELPRQVDHYTRASRNIAQQQVEVGRRLAELSPPPKRVFVGDAGAIPYVSDLPSLDGLGLGGYHRMPFARASTLGVGAVVELIERLPPEARPDMLAIYDSWWPDLGATFGRREFSVRIEDNVICGDPEKVVYRADWSALEDRRELERGALFRLDLGDLVDEEAFHVELPHPHAGYVIFAVHADERGRATFDAERSLAEGQWMSFEVPELPASPRSVRLEIKTDSPAGTPLMVEAASGSRTIEVSPHDAAWGTASVDLDHLASHERVRIVASGSPVKIGSVRALAEPTRGR